MLHAFQPAASLIVSASLLVGGVGSTAAQGLPGGATSLNETHGDWTVICTTPDGNVRCAISQMQVNSGNRQRVLTVELTAAKNGNAASGTLVMPFGLKLDDGVRLAIDEAAPGKPLRFSTCLPAGCLVPLSFDADMVSALKSGTALSVTVNANDGGQGLVFSISLSGFASALARAAELGGS